MKKWMLVAILLLLLPVTAGAIDVNMIAITEGGTIDTNASYYAFGGTATPKDPAFESRYQSYYYSKGNAGLLTENSFAGAMAVKEQFEVQSGYGRFLTKAGTGSLINISREDAPGIIDGTLMQNAAGFGGVLMPGIVTSTFATKNGLIANSNAEGIGEFRAGAIQKVETGSNEPGTGPTVIESQAAHFRLDGTFKVQVEFIFPK